MAGHEPVLLKEAIDFLCVNPHGVYLDATGGGGGHARQLLSRVSQRARLLICDFHSETVEGLKRRFQHDARVRVQYSRFSQIFDNLNFSPSRKGFDGILADFGVSSEQLGDERLGIGFSIDGVFLDMRLDKNLKTTAAQILATWSEKELADLFYHAGGERAARKIAAAITLDRRSGTLYQTTDALRDLCSRVLGKYYRKRRIHPATKVFQALRIAVNKEREEIRALLNRAPHHLKAGGRLVTISFHAGEDRLVKERFRELARTGDFDVPVKKVVRPSREEIKANPRARSARLRVLQKKRVS